MGEATRCALIAEFTTRNEMPAYCVKYGY
jgi:hypothetical protein